MSKDPAYQAYAILKFVAILFPILFGLDKFFNYLDSWDKYFSFSLVGYAGADAETLLKGIGVVEILLGIGVIFKTRLFAYLVALLTFLVCINIWMSSHFYGVGLRDFCLGLSAIALARLSLRYEGHHHSL